jgi:precorrin-6A/cobalt-precorrin-6A reductase
MTLLLLAGSGEAKRIAWGLVGSGINTVASLAGVTRDPDALPIPTRIGGFGGEEGFADYLQSAAITAVLDATHPFATSISARTWQMCAARGLPYCQVMRPEWQPEPGDDWTFIDTEADAAAHIGPEATVFLGTGRQTLAGFANLEGRRVICRQIDPPTAPFPFAGGEFLIGRPPFSTQSEVALFTALGIDVIVVKNAGGAASRTKLDAARILGIPVLMIRRPPPTGAPIVTSVTAALDWARSL